MKKKLLIFITIFLIAMIITYAALPISHALDSYCTICHGYKDTAMLFLKNGRVFSYLFYLIFGLIKLPYDHLGIISVILGNLILSYTILKLYLVLNRYLDQDGKYFKYLLLLLIILMYYNPLYISILLLDEAFIIDLGILFVTLASIHFAKRNNIRSLIFMILGVMCYQGIAIYFVVISLLFMTIDELKLLRISKFINLMVIYGLSFLSNLIIIKVVGMILKDSTSKVGSFNIFTNLVKIFTKLLPSSLWRLFGFIDVKRYCILIFILLIIIIVNLIRNRYSRSDFLSLCLLLAGTIFSPFIPNIFMNSEVNYIDARMALTLGCIPIVLLLFIFFNFRLYKKDIYVFGIIIVLILGITTYRTHQNMNIDLRRYHTDIEYMNKLKDDILIVQDIKETKVDTIYFAYDTDHAYYYDFGHSNGANIRLLAVDWAFECAVKAYIDKDINVYKMDDKMYNSLFKDKNYSEFNNDELVYDNNILYLLLY